MNLTHIKYFHAICKFGSLSDAAIYLYISQPALSAAIKDLENEFGVVLFQRHRRGMMLTSEGEFFQRTTQHLLREIADVESVMRDLGVARKTLRLGVPPMIGSLVLPKIYRSFPLLCPDIKLDIVEGGRQELCKKLDEGVLDLLFLPHNKPFEGRFEAKKVTELEIVCCCTAASPIASLHYVTPDLLKDTSLVLFANSFFQTDEIKKWFAAQKISPNILLQTNQLSTMMSVISSGTAVGFAFRDLLNTYPDLVAVPMQESMQIDVSLVRKTDSHTFGTMRRFQDYILNKSFWE